MKGEYELREAYAKHGTCPRCGEQAVREHTDEPDAHQCDACHTTLEDFDDVLEKPDRPHEVYHPDLSEIGDAKSMDEVYEEGGATSGLSGALHKGTTGRDTGHDSRTLASSLLFGVGVLLCLTIIGAPFGLAFIVIARKISPNEPEWQGLPRGDDDDDN